VSVHHLQRALESDLPASTSEYTGRAPGRTISYSTVLRSGEEHQDHTSDVQQKLFTLLGITEKTRKTNSGSSQGALLRRSAARDRVRPRPIVMLMLGSKASVIPYRPKTSAGISLMDGSPDRVDERQLQNWYQNACLRFGSDRCEVYSSLRGVAAAIASHKQKMR